MRFTFDRVIIWKTPLRNQKSRKTNHITKMGVADTSGQYLPPDVSKACVHRVHSLGFPEKSTIRKIEKEIRSLHNPFFIQYGKKPHSI